MKKLFLILCTTVLLAACAGKPIYNVEQSSVPDGLNKQEVQEAIVLGLMAKGWKVKDKEDGKVIANIIVRQKHHATIEVDYDEKNYSIKYVSSQNLDYNAKKHTIHKNYNNWVIYVDQQIQQRLVEKTYNRS